MIIGWTTTERREDAERLARGAVTVRLAACAQVEGPVRSFYHWEGKMAEADEFRVWFKAIPANAAALGAWVQHHHPSAVPQWLEVNAENVGEKYLSWAMANSTPDPFPSQLQP